MGSKRTASGPEKSRNKVLREAPARYAATVDGWTGLDPTAESPDDPAHTIRQAQYLMARKAFPTDAALADAIGVHRSQITRWKGGEPASPDNAWLLRDLAFACETLSEHLDPGAAHAWLHGHSPELGGETALEAIRGGRVADVLMALQAQVSGALF